MARNQTVTGTVHNIFALNRVRIECYYESIRVDFSPIQKPNNIFEEIVPLFNRDRNYFTPSFILKRQKSTLEQNLLAQKNKFLARISHSQNPSQDQTPQYRPTDSKYCQLCHEYFSDYWQHINGKYHKRMINSSKFNKDIQALCQSFVYKGKGKNPCKTKKIEKKKVDKKVNKARDSKVQDKNTGQNIDGKSDQVLKIQIKDDSMKENLENLDKKNTEQSLKIKFQLGNYSTNLLSNNTFKHLCRDS